MIKKFLAALLFLGLAGSAHAVQLTIQPDATAGKDCYTAQDAPTTNNPTDTIFFVGETTGIASAARHGLIQFTFPETLRGATISSVTFSLYATLDRSDITRTARVFRLKRAWAEDQATWNVYTTGNNWQVAGGTGENDSEQTDIGFRVFSASETLNEFKEFPLNISAIQDMLPGGTWTNNGFLVKMDTELNDAYVFATSDDGTAANRPKLYLEYITGSGSRRRMIIQ